MVAGIHRVKGRGMPAVTPLGAARPVDRPYGAEAGSVSPGGRDLRRRVREVGGPYPELRAGGDASTASAVEVNAGADNGAALGDGRIGGRAVVAAAPAD